MKDEEVKRIARALEQIGTGTGMTGAPGALEFIGMTLRDGVKINVELREEDAKHIAESIDNVAEAIRLLAKAIELK